MIATIINSADGINTAHRRENSYAGGYIALAVTPEGVRECVDLKLYSTDARSYACAWLYYPGFYSSGSGMAGGYGYHRASAAAGRALRAAGVSLDEDIDGRGDGAVRDAVEAIAQAMFPGCPVHVVRAHA